MSTPNAPLICNRLVAIMREVEAIGKNKKNQSQGFSYRGIDDVYNALNPLLAKHGVFTAPEVLKIEREHVVNQKGTNLNYSIVTMKHVFFAEDGSCVSTTVVGEGMDSGDKATNKAMAIAHKYALFQIFCIPTEDVVDPDAESHVTVPPPPMTAEQLEKIMALDVGDNKVRILAALNHYKVKDIRNLTHHQAETIINKLSSQTK